MTYPELILAVLAIALGGGALSWVTRRTVRLDTLRRHHEIGNAVFVQLGVVFAVLLAFVFNEVWSEYNVAASSIEQETASLHGIGLMADSLPAPARAAVHQAVRAYAEAVIRYDWPAMQHDVGSKESQDQLVLLWRAVTAAPGAHDDLGDVRGQMLNLLAHAHQMRETRLADAATDVPVLLWALLLTFALAIVGTMLCFGMEYVWSQVAFTAVFVACIGFTLLLVHMLDRPFEGALMIHPTAFESLLTRMRGPG